MNSRGLSLYLTNQQPQVIYEIYILIGDSIARGNSNPQVPGPTPNSETVYEWNGSALVEITTNDLALAEGGSPWPRHGINRNLATGKIIIYVNCAQGGSTITDKEDSGRIWSATGPGSLWQDAVDKAAGALLIPNSVLRGVVISGGVNDFREPIKPTADEYKLAYQDLIDRVNAEWDTPDIFLFQVVRSGSESGLACDMREKVMELEVDNANVYVAHNSLGFFAQSLTSADSVHFIQDGNNKVGEQINIFQSLSGTKRLRRLYSSFSTTISDNHKTAWATFFDSCETHGNLSSIEFLEMFVSSTDLNRKMEITGTGIPQLDSAAHVANSHVATDGISTFIGAGYIPSFDLKNATQDDIIVGVKVKTITTPGTTTAGIFGTQAGTQFYLLQTASGMQYRVNDGTATVWNGKQKPSDNSFIAIGRNGTTKFLMDDATQAHSAVAASVGAIARPMSVGARNLNFGSNDLFCAGEWECFFACRWTTLTSYTDLLTDLNTLIAALKL